MALFATLLVSPICIAGPGAPLLQKADLEYLGAFRVPSGDIGGSTFMYGGRVLAFNPANASLYIVGSPDREMVAEISIPELVDSSSVGGLSTAVVRQTFADASEGLRQKQDNGNGVVTGGLLVHGERLIGTVYRSYDAGRNTQSVSHYSRPLDLTVTGQVSGLTRVGPLQAGFVSGYMTRVPGSWIGDIGATALTGNCCISIITRTSFGPALFAFDPEMVGSSSSVPAKPLVYYPQSNPLDRYDATGELFNGTSRVTGVIFPEGSSSVLFFGHHGTGKYCYGTGSQCGDPVNPHQGDHAYPYRAQIWAYDANELVRVKNGQIRPWSVRPYDVWHFSTPFESSIPGGVAYDSATARMFVAQRGADGGRPVILVFQIGKASRQESAVE